MKNDLVSQIDALMFDNIEYSANSITASIYAHFKVAFYQALIDHVKGGARLTKESIEALFFKEIDGIEKKIAQKGKSSL